MVFRVLRFPSLMFNMVVWALSDVKGPAVTSGIGALDVACTGRAGSMADGGGSEYTSWPSGMPLAIGSKC